MVDTPESEVARYQQTDNWFDYPEFYRWIAGHEEFRTFAEVGVWKGHSVTFLANLLRNRPDVTIHAIDLFENTYTYRDSPELVPQLELIRQIYEANLRASDTRALISDITAMSHEAASLFPDQHFDMVFLDADHSYEQVRRDIDAWQPKVKRCGILAGHDFDASWPGVQRAVHESFAGQFKLHSKYVWYVRL